MAVKILVVDDDRKFCQQLKTNLEAYAHQVWTESDGNKTFSLLEVVNPDIIILDVNLELDDKNGLDICGEIRQHPRYIDRSLGIILVSGHYIDEIDQLSGLQLGAYEYLVKPFAPMLLEAKVRILYSLLNRPQSNKIQIGDDLTIYLDRRQVTVDGKPVELARREFDVLVYLAQPPDTVRSRYEILEHVYGGQDFENGAIDKCIHGIRSKISPTERERFIKASFGVGYRLSTEG